MVEPTRPVAGAVIAVELATDVAFGGGVDSEQPIAAIKIVTSTSGSPRRSRAATTRFRHTGSARRLRGATLLLARSGGRTHEQCRGIVIDPDDLAVQLWAIPHSTDSELLGSHRCDHRPSTARVWPKTPLNATPMARNLPVTPTAM